MTHINLEQYTIAHMNPQLHLSNKDEIEVINNSQPGCWDLHHIDAQATKELEKVAQYCSSTDLKHSI